MVNQSASNQQEMMCFCILLRIPLGMPLLVITAFPSILFLPHLYQSTQLFRTVQAPPSRLTVCEPLLNYFVLNWSGISHLMKSFIVPRKMTTFLHSMSQPYNVGTRGMLAISEKTRSVRFNTLLRRILFQALSKFLLEANKKTTTIFYFN